MYTERQMAANHHETCILVYLKTEYILTIASVTENAVHRAGP